MAVPLCPTSMTGVATISNISSLCSAKFTINCHKCLLYRYVQFHYHRQSLPVNARSVRPSSVATKFIGIVSTCGDSVITFCRVNIFSIFQNDIRRTKKINSLHRIVDSDKNGNYNPQPLDTFTQIFHCVRYVRLHWECLGTMFQMFEFLFERYTTQYFSVEINLTYTLTIREVNSSDKYRKRYVRKRR